MTPEIKKKVDRIIYAMEDFANEGRTEDLANARRHFNGLLELLG